MLVYGRKKKGIVNEKSFVSYTSVMPGQDFLHTYFPHGGSSDIPSERGVSKAKLFKGEVEAKLKFPEGG